MALQHIHHVCARLSVYYAYRQVSVQICHKRTSLYNDQFRSHQGVVVYDRFDCTMITVPVQWHFSIKYYGYNTI